MKVYNIFRITSDQCLVWHSAIVHYTPMEAINQTVRAYPELVPYKKYLVAQHHDKKGLTRGVFGDRVS